jgi:hypothetical protein
MRISFLHTAQAHVETFDNIFSQLDQSIELVHRVEPDLLSRARSEGLDAVRDTVHAILASLSKSDAVVCTCSTLGPLADEVSASLRHVIRVDRPMMEKACQDGENIVVAICLDSTRDATLALLMGCAADLGKTISPRVVLCETAWKHFEAGAMEDYARDIANTVRADVLTRPDTDCIVLAQASMRVAESLLGSTGIPVRSSPMLAAERSIEVVKFRGAARS